MMIKLISLWGMLLTASLSASASEAHDKLYFKVHPKALQEAIAKCPSESPKLVNCDELHQIAIKVNEYVYALRISPQGYGQSILALQQTIANQVDKPELKTQYEQNLQELRERLAIVSWLESPGGAS